MPTQNITLDLPVSVLEKANQMAHILQRSLDDIIAQTLMNVLPDVEDCPSDMQAELMQMTWTDNQVLWQIAQGQMSEKDQDRLQFLSKRHSSGMATPDEEQALQALREQYGQITLRKARAYALLSLRGGTPLLSDEQAG